MSRRGPVRLVGAEDRGGTALLEAVVHGDDGRTALGHAEARGQHEVARLLRG